MDVQVGTATGRRINPETEQPEEAVLTAIRLRDRAMVNEVLLEDHEADALEQGLREHREARTASGNGGIEVPPPGLKIPRT